MKNIHAQINCIIKCWIDKRLSDKIKAGGDDMDIFAIIYKILRYLEKSLDYDELDMGQISNEKLRISYNRWEKILILMQENGYISGLSVFRTIDGVEGIDSPIRIKITIDGLEYLEKLEKLYACTNKNN